MKKLALLLVSLSLTVSATPLIAQSDQQQSALPNQQQNAQSNQQPSTHQYRQQGAQSNQQQTAQRPKPAMRGFGAGSNVVNSATGVAGGGRTN
jgi:hypothetical protein